MTIVTITTGSRLHFGPLSVAAPAGGRFGGVGVMIDHPCVVVSARIAACDSIQADEGTTLRVAEFLRRIRNSLPVGQLPECEITVSETIPSHRGFGSGTQLGLAVARCDIGDRRRTGTVARNAGSPSRAGLRSAIGLYGFAQGGFLVDGGRSDSNQVGTLVSRVEFPGEWRFVIAAPRESIGLFGEAEQSAFASQPPMPPSLTGELCRIVLMDWLPSVIQSDFRRCGESMSTFGNSVGEFFSNAQGGVFAHPRMAEWAKLVRRGGIRGVAQTSWGPTVAALCPSDVTAEQLIQDFANDSAWNDCSFKVVSPLNRGAAIVLE